MIGIRATIAMGDTSGQILVVDDDLEMRALVKDVLEEEGHQVTTAESGRDALQRLSEGEYAVVLTDLRMQGMQGLELLSSIKEEIGRASCRERVL